MIIIHIITLETLVNCIWCTPLSQETVLQCFDVAVQLAFEFISDLEAKRAAPPALLEMLQTLHSMWVCVLLVREVMQLGGYKLCWDCDRGFVRGGV